MPVMGFLGGTLGGTLVLATVRSCPFLALGSVCEASSDPQFVAASTGLGSAGTCPSCAPRLVF